MTTAVFYALYGKRIHDTQTGLRAIPNAFIKDCIQIEGERFEYETRMLIAAARKKQDIIEVPIQTVYFDDNRETHFDPIKDSMRIYKILLSGFCKFAASSLLCVAVDQGLFTLMAGFVLGGLSKTVSIPAATAAARAVSSLLNYALNHTLVFKSDGKASKSLVRYYFLCVLQTAASAVCVTGFHLLTRINPSVLKLIVDTMLFFASYQIQRRWVFSKEG